MPKKARTAAADLPRYLRQLAPEHLSEVELAILRICSEAVAVPLDQLARYLDSDVKDTTVLVDGLRELGCVYCDQILEGDSPWVRPTPRGARLSETGIRARERPPGLATLEHRRAVHEARLDLRSRYPRGRWLSEGAFCSRRRAGVHIPDGAFEVGGKQLAVEVELSRKSPPHLRRVIAQHSKRFDSVLYYVAPPTRQRLLELKASGEFPKLVVRDLAGVASPSRERTRFPKRSANPWEKDLLRLVADQGGIPTDQLARFLGRSLADTEEVVDQLVAQNFVGRESLLAGEQQWIWVKKAGAISCASTLVCRRPRLGGIERMRVLNELRLHFIAKRPGALWVSRRQLKRAFGQYEVGPDSLLEEGEEKLAIVVRFHNRHLADFERRIEVCNQSFGSVICFCANEGVHTRMSALAAEHPEYGLLVETLPAGGAIPS